MSKPSYDAADPKELKYLSLSALRAEHNQMLRRHYAISSKDKSDDMIDDEFIRRIQRFVSDAAATGVMLEEERVRRDAQSLIDYWMTVLGRYQDNYDDTVLLDFDKDCARRQHDFFRDEGEKLFDPERTNWDAVLEGIFLALFRACRPNRPSCAAISRQKLLESVRHHTENADEIIQQCINAQLLRAVKDNENPSETIELAHEWLIEAWPRLARLAGEVLSEEIQRNRIVDLAYLWKKTNHDAGVCIGGEALKTAETFRHLHEPVPEYLDACETLQKKSRERAVQRKKLRRRYRIARWIVVVMALVSLILFLLIVRIYNAERETAAAKKEKEILKSIVNSWRVSLNAKIVLADDPELSAKLVQIAADNLPHTEKYVDLIQRVKREMGNVLFQALRGRRVEQSLRLPDESKGSILAIAFHSGTNRLACAVSDGTACVWNTKTWEIDKVIRAHKKPVNIVAFSPNGEYLATGSDDRKAVISSLKTEKKVFDTKDAHKDEIWDLAFSPDGKILATSSLDGTIRIWEQSTEDAMNQWKQINTIGLPVSKSFWFGTEPKDQFVSVSVGPKNEDGTYGVVAGTRSGEVAVWRVPNDKSEKITIEIGTLLPRAPEDEGIMRVAYCRNPKLPIIAVAGKDGTAKIWHVGLEKPKVLFHLRGHRDWVRSVSFTDDGQFVSTASKDGTAKLWELPSDLEKQMQQSEPLPMRPLQAKVTLRQSYASELFDSTFVTTRNTDRPDFLATATASGEVAVWRVNYNKRALDVQASAELNSLAMHPNGDLVAVVDKDGHVRLYGKRRKGKGKIQWKKRPSKEEDGSHKGHTGKISCVAFNANGSQLATGSTDETICIWKVDRGTVEFTKRLKLEDAKGPKGFTMSVAFSPDGKYLAAAGEYEYVVEGTKRKCVRIWDIQSGQEITYKNNDRPSHSQRIYSVVFSPDGKLLATAGGDWKAIVWSTKSGKKEGELRFAGRVYAVAFSSDSKYFAGAGDDKKAKILDLGKSTIHKLEGHNNPIYSIHFTRENRIVTASGDKTIRIWDLSSSFELFTLEDANEAVYGSALTRNRKQIASVSVSGMLRFYDIDVDGLTLANLLDEAKNKIHRKLNNDEKKMYLPQD